MQKMSIDSPSTMNTALHSAQGHRRWDLAWEMKRSVNPMLFHVQDIGLRCRSFSLMGTAMLDSDLIAQEPRFHDVVIAHEYLHPRVPVHGGLFQARMSAYVRGWRKLTEQRSSSPSGGGTCGQ